MALYNDKEPPRQEVIVELRRRVYSIAIHNTLIVTTNEKPVIMEPTVLSPKTLASPLPITEISSSSMWKRDRIQRGVTVEVIPLENGGFGGWNYVYQVKPNLQVHRLVNQGSLLPTTWKMLGKCTRGARLSQHL